MKFRNLGKSGQKVSAYCIGTSLFGEVTSEEDAAQIMSASRDAGINFVDTAPTYAGGRAEEVLGRLLKPVRNHWLVGTKVSAGNPKRMEEGLNCEWITSSVERSLRRLGTDRVDLLYLHRHDARVPLGESIEAIGGLIRAGKVRYFGFSNYSGWQIGEIVRLCDATGTARPVAAQPYYNAVTRGPEVDYLPACAHYGIGVVPYSGLARGVLTGKYDPGAPPAPDSRAARGDKRMLESAFLPEVLEAAQKIKVHAMARGMTAADFALAWLLAHKCVSSVLVGARNSDQLAAYLSALDHELNEADEAAVDAIVSPGHHASPGYNDPLYPVTGRQAAPS